MRGSTWSIWLAACSVAVAEPPASTVAGETTLELAFPAPEGASRVPTAGFGAWLRTLPVYPADREVHDFDGRLHAMPSARVVKLPLVRGDLQQCADSILRVRATWERTVGRDPAFHYTSGDVSRWAEWRSGTRLVVAGAPRETVNRVPRQAPADDSEASFEAWLTDLFTYAGTRSLPTDTVVPSGPILPGDVLVTPGSPGHAVLILDVATRAQDTWVLVGQGFMPAMDFHVVQGESEGWYRVGDAGPLATRPIPMDWASRRRFP